MGMSLFCTASNTIAVRSMNSVPQPLTSASDTPNPAVPCCDRCALAQACEGRQLDLEHRLELHAMMRSLGPFKPGAFVFRQGAPFDSITAVHSGTVKTYVIDPDGREQVLGFFLPGEMLGLDAIHSGHYPCHAVALDTVTLCSAPFPALSALARRERSLQARLFCLLSHDIRKASALVGDHTAEERVAAFLWALWQHQAEINPAHARLDLAMSRTDIANYLRLASETVSRIFQRLQQLGIIQVNRRRVELRDLARLEALATATLRPSS